MPEFVDWRHAADPAALVEHAAGMLRDGNWVVVPTECGSAAVARMNRADAELLSGDNLDWSLAPASLDSWLPRLDPAAQRLIRRAWPGPALFEIDSGGGDPPVGSVHPLVYRRICKEGAWALRLPGHEVVLALLDRFGEPLVLAEPKAADYSAWIAAQCDSVALVLEDGPPAFDNPPTRVRITGRNWQLQREGVYSQVELQRLAAFVIVFLCTGNTCRSPMAEALCKKLLADRLGCDANDLTPRGWWVLSAGLAAAYGEPATPEADTAVRTLGTSMGEHASRPVRPELVEQADLVIVMTQAQADLVREMFPVVQPRVLGGDRDLPDPFGASQTEYDDCARTIQRHLQALLAEVLPP
jgi:protein-tyrosine-phosphatase/tRNA A37 threonylcarbamoyladenosine synthetase subunit TsaC/SUA5/YrdC